MYVYSSFLISYLTIFVAVLVFVCWFVGFSVYLPDVPRKFPFCLVYDISAFEPIVFKSDIFFILLKYLCEEMQAY